MKKLFILSIVLVFSFVIVKATDYDTIAVVENGEIVKKAIPKQEKEIILEKIGFYESIDPKIFSDYDANDLISGKPVEKTISRYRIPIKLFPFVKTEDYETACSYERRQDIIVPEWKPPRISPAKEDIGSSIAWIYLPFIFAFVISYFSTKDERGKYGFMLFSLFVIVALASTALIGEAKGTIIGAFSGMIIVGIAGGIGGLLINKNYDKTALIGGISGIISGLFTGSFSGEIAGATSKLPLIVWRYIFTYIIVCVLAFAFRETIASIMKKKSKKNSVE